MVTVLPPSFISIQDMQESHLFNAHFGAKQANRGVNHKGSRSARCVEQRDRKTTSPSPPKSYTAEQARTFLARPSSRARRAHRRAACAPPSSNSTARRTLWRVMHSCLDISRTWRIRPFVLRNRVRALALTIKCNDTTSTRRRTSTLFRASGFSMHRY